MAYNAYAGEPLPDIDETATEEGDWQSAALAQKAQFDELYQAQRDEDMRMACIRCALDLNAQRPGEYPDAQTILSHAAAILAFVKGEKA